MTKSQRCLPPTYAPSLVFSHGKGYNDQTFCTLSDGCYHVRSVPQMRRMFYFTSSYGWLMLRSYESLDCYLFNPVSLEKIHLPSLIHNSYNECVLTTSPSDTNCIVMCISNAKRSYIFCRIGDNKWIEQQLRPKKHNDHILIEGHISVIACKGKIYLFFSQGVAVINFQDNFSSIELQPMNFPEFASPWVSCFRYYHVESCGEIFRIVEIRFGASSNLVFNFDVFKLDLSTMDWEKVESLGDRIFLLGESSMSVSATELGLKGNCMYFCCPGFTILNKFDMEDRTLTVTLPCPKKIPQWEGPFWVVPNCKVQVKKDLAKTDKPQDEANQEQSWKDLPKELLELVFSSLSLGDCIRFRLTCKSWISITPILHTNCLPNAFEWGYQEGPWLMSFLRNKGACKLYHPIYSDVYTMNIPELAGATIRSANYGWLLMSQGELSFFFLNPFTMETIELPDMERGYLFTGMSFSSPPTSADFVVIGYLGSLISVYRKGQETWCDYELDAKWEFAASPCSPAFCDGIFYCLSKNGKLGLFDPTAITEESQWKIIPKSQLFPYSDVSSYTNCVKIFIVEYDGEILSVFVGYLGKSVLIYKLNRREMKWERLESLDDKVLFLSHTASMLLPARLKGIENRIYFPGFHDRDNMFYSLSTGKYHSFGSKHSCEDWINTCEHLHCTWIQSTK
ncbi:hypothetical protein AQUCO_03800028v1 [Aquilegia coerulea]|uniref:F-box domain-containing protein n=1 Tax=Aquilegia coerulea TaxID=218851 RepID=A0A2G5CS97_AQUCA|nr:hypothetical protein AQUCO_03800028v1 [Aquilegia coerulea]